MRTIDKNTIQSYQNHIYTQEKSQNTIDKYIRDIRTFTAWLQTQEQKDITKECVIRYKEHLEAKYMPASANSMLIALNGFFGYTGWHDCFVTIFKTQPNHIYAQEKEMILIITEQENKLKIMQAISAKCGLHSEADGLVLSLPIDTVIGGNGGR